MKKISKMAVTLALGATVLFSSCIGSFALWNKVLDWNNTIGDKWVNELVFIVCNIVPVYEVAYFIDGVVLNTIEFWTGSNPVAAGETKTIQSEDGQYVVMSNENGYTVTKDDKSVDFVYNQEDNSWNLSSEGETVELMRVNADGTATLCNGKTVTMDAAGMMAARMSLNNSVLASR